MFLFGSGYTTGLLLRTLSKELKLAYALSLTLGTAVSGNVTFCSLNIMLAFFVMLYAYFLFSIGSSLTML